MARVLLAGLMAAALVPAQPLRFDVVSLRPSKDGGGKGGLQTLPDGGLRMGGVTAKQLIAMAYGVREEHIGGGPKWIDSEAYNLLAKNAEGTRESATIAPGDAGWKRLELRLQSLLADRFSLAIHTVEKSASGYALLVAKGGSKISPVNEQTPPGTMRSPGRIDGRNGSMQMLAEVLSGLLARPVENRTGLSGGFTYKLEYAVADDSGPSVFTALQEQLGLKLESTKVIARSIVIDRILRPTEN